MSTDCGFTNKISKRHIQHREYLLFHMTRHGATQEYYVICSSQKNAKTKNKEKNTQLHIPTSICLQIKYLLIFRRKKCSHGVCVCVRMLCCNVNFLFTYHNIHNGQNRRFYSERSLTKKKLSEMFLEFLVNVYVRIRVRDAFY